MEHTFPSLLLLKMKQTVNGKSIHIINVQVYWLLSQNVRDYIAVLSLPQAGTWWVAFVLYLTCPSLLITYTSHMVLSAPAKHFVIFVCENTIQINAPSLLTGGFDGLLLGDRGYPCHRNLLTPLPWPWASPQQHFDVAHCRMRACVEMTIGLLKAFFQCLHHLRVTPERAFDIIMACLVLHNTLPNTEKTSSIQQILRMAEHSEILYAEIISLINQHHHHYNHWHPKHYNKDNLQSSTRSSSFPTNIKQQLGSFRHCSNN